MTQYDWGTMVPTDSGLTLVGDLNSYRDAANSTHRGAAAPSYRVAGMQWINDSVIPWQVNIYDGTSWILRYTIHPTEHSVRHEGPHIAAPGMSLPTPTVAGEAWFDTARLRLMVGTGASTAYFSMCQWEHITKGTLSGSTMDATFMSEDWRMLRISYKVIPSTSASAYVKISEDYGGTWVSTVSYRHLNRIVRGSAVSASLETTTGIRLNSLQSISAVGNYGAWGILTICDFGEWGDKYAYLTGGFHGVTDGQGIVYDHVMRTLPGIFTAGGTGVQLSVSAGTMTGWWSIEGMKNHPQG